MGIFKRFQPAISLETWNTLSGSTFSKVITVPEYKDTNGTSRTTSSMTLTSTINANYVVPSVLPYSNLTPVASTDILSGYSVDDYALNSVGTATSSQAPSGATNTITVNVKNSTPSDITVGCIKFHKNIYWQTNDYSNPFCDVLICAYYFDTPKTLAPNESFTTAIKFDFGVEGADI